MDRRRVAGRFLLTGSANVLLLPKLADSLAERIVAGVVLYDGETTARFGEGLWAVPVRAMWET